MNAFLKIKNRLLEHDVKPSLHRVGIMEFLLNNPIHPTVDQIYQELHPSLPTLSKTTVYNTLKLLENHGVIQSILIDDKNIRYDANVDFHAHFKCKECEEIFDLYVDNTEIARIKSLENFSTTECLLYYKGYCDKCKNDKC